RVDAGEAQPVRNDPRIGHERDRRHEPLRSDPDRVECYDPLGRRSLGEALLERRFELPALEPRDAIHAVQSGESTVLGTVGAEKEPSIAGAVQTLERPPTKLLGPVRSLLARRDQGRLQHRRSADQRRVRMLALTAALPVEECEANPERTEETCRI